MKNSFSFYTPLRSLKPFGRVFFALMIVSLSANAARAASQRINGIVLNATKIKPATGLKVELIRPAVSAAEGSLVATATTDAQGRFEFGNQQVAADELLLVRVAYQGYGYLAAAFDGGQRLKDFGVTARPDAVQVQVYEATSRSPQLKFTVHHLAIESSEKGIKCIERILVENPSRNTFTGIGPNKGTVLLDIPAGARDMKMDAKIPGKLIKTSHGWMATTPIAPAAYVSKNPLAGPNAIIFEYYIDWPSVLPWARTVSLSQKVLYPTNFLFVARTSEDKVLQVVAPKLSKDEEQQLPIDGQTETRVVNSIGRPMGDTPALKPEERLDIKVSREVNPLFWAFLSFLVVMCVAVPLALRGSRRAPRPDFVDDDEEVDLPPVAVAASAPVPGDAVRGLVEQIAQLDEDYEGGRIAAADYRSRRAQWKADAVRLAERAEPVAAAEEPQKNNGNRPPSQAKRATNLSRVEAPRGKQR
jgi:hypothetical protein